MVMVIKLVEVEVLVAVVVRVAVVRVVAGS